MIIVKSKEINMQQISGDNFDPNNHAVALVSFYSDTCGACRLMMPLLTRLAQSMPAVSFFTADIALNTQLKNAYSVDNLPLIIIFKNGNEVKRLNALIGAKSLKQIIQNFID